MSQKDKTKGQAELIAHSVIAQGEMVKTQDYLQRGRRYAGLTDGELQALWVQMTRKWSENAFERTKELDDTDVEFIIRNISPPYHLVISEIEQIAKIISDSYEAMTDEERRKANSIMTAEFNRDRTRLN